MDRQNDLQGTPPGALLQSAYLFSPLDQEEIQNLISYLHNRSYPAGHLLFREGDPGDELFIIREGKVRISIRLPDGSQRVLRDFGRGDFFGEMAIVENDNRSATAEIMEHSQLYVMKKSDFFGIMHDFPSIAIKIMYRMSTITTERLHSTSEFLEEMVLWGEEARKRTVTDALTGTYNREFLDSSLPRMVQDAARRGTQLSLLMVDLDHFRVMNEKYGQETGDRVLQAAVSVFAGCMREKDVLARYGGDEFTIVLPETGVKEAERIAERIRMGVAGMSLHGCLPPDESQPGRVDSLDRITTSQGLAVYPLDAEDHLQLHERADRALYRSKELGRNRVSRAGA
jgi:diguanylate cyclase (GGDEF)-like protein